MDHGCSNADQIISDGYDTPGWREMPGTHKMCIQDRTGSVSILPQNR